MDEEKPSSSSCTLPMESNESMAVVPVPPRIGRNLAVCGYTLDYFADEILSYCGPEALYTAEGISTVWRNIAIRKELWRKMLDKKIPSDPVWLSVIRIRQWVSHLYKSPEFTPHEDHLYCRKLYTYLAHEVKTVENSWKNLLQGSVLPIEAKLETAVSIECLQLTPEKIVGGFCDGSIRIFSRLNFERILMIREHRSAIVCLLIYQHMIISSAYDFIICFSDLDSGYRFNRIVWHQSCPMKLFFTNDTLIAYTKSRHVIFWLVNGIDEINAYRTIESPPDALTADISNRCVIYGCFKVLRVQYLFCDAPLLTLKGHSHGVTAVKITLKYAVSTDNQGFAILWDAEGWKKLKMWNVHHSPISSIWLDDKRVVISGRDKKLNVIDMEKFKDPKYIRQHNPFFYFMHKYDIKDIQGDECTLAFAWQRKVISIFSFMCPVYQKANMWNPKELDPIRYCKQPFFEREPLP